MKQGFFFLLLILSLLIFSCEKDKLEFLDEGIYAQIETKKGNIIIKLLGEEVPLTVSNFIALAEGNHPNVTDSLKGKKFYDNLAFYRVITNVMIQSGNYPETSTGDPGYVFGDEFPRDTLGNLLFKHDTIGVLSMANNGPSTNGSEFFITRKPTPWLNGIHTVFGNVVFGQNVVDSIAQNDTIKHIKIIRKGDFANDFDAPVVFTNEMELFAKKEADRKEKLSVKKELFLDSLGFKKATRTDSGLRILTLEKGDGEKVKPHKEITCHLILHTATGKLISKSEDQKPFIFTVDDQPMVTGFKEGILKMRVGDKKRFFVPYYIGYGEVVNGPIPAKSDLIFEVEILKIGI